MYGNIAHHRKHFHVSNTRTHPTKKGTRGYTAPYDSDFGTDRPRSIYSGLRAEHADLRGGVRK